MINTERWTNQIDSTTDAFKKEFGMLTPEQLNWKPNTQTWSIGQNMDHLIVINGTYYPIIKQVREGTYKTPWMGKIGFLVNFFGKMILNSVQPDRRRKTNTFAIWEPSNSSIGADIIDKLTKHNEELKELIIECLDLIEKGTVICSPANKKIVYKLETAFDIIVTHEKRHLEQAKGIKELLLKVEQI